MTRGLFSIAALLALCCAARLDAAVIHRADETAVQGDVVALENGSLTVATRAADGSEQKVTIPLEDVVEVNFDPSATAPAPPVAPPVAVAQGAPAPAGPRSNRKGVSAHFYNAQFWKSPKPAGGLIGPGRSPGEPPEAAKTGQDALIIVTAPDVNGSLPTLSNLFGQDPPAEGLNKDSVSAAFSGRIRPKETGDYTFVCRSDDDHWLLVDGRLVCSDPGAHGARDAREGARPDTIVPVKLEAGKDYDFLFLANEGLVDFTAVAQWIPPGKSEPEDIPEDCLFAESGPPAAPSDLKVSATTDTSVTLSFRDVATSEIRYEVERATEPGFVNPVSAGVAPINATGFVDKELSRGVTYYYRLRAVNFEGPSVPAVVAATPGVLAGEQQAVAAAKAAAGAAPVTRAGAAVEPPAVPRGDKKGVTAQFFNAQYWRSPNPVVATRPGEAGADGTATADGAPAAPAQAVVVSAAPDASTTLTSLNNNFAEESPHPGINRDDVSAAFTGRIRPKETGQYTFVCTTDDDHWLFVNGQLVCSDPGPHSARDAREGAAPESIIPIKLEAGKDYDFVFLVNEGARDFTCHAMWVPPGRSEPEEIPEDCLLAQTGAPAAPAELRVAEVSDSGVTLTFRDASTSEVRFSVERDLGPEFLNPAPAGSVPINGGKFVDKELRKGVTYYYRVRAVNFDGRSAPAVVAATPGVPVAQQQAVAAAAAARPPAAAQLGAVQAAAAQPAAAPVRATPLKKEKGVSARYYATQFWKSSDPRVIGGEVTVIGEPDVTTTVPSLENDFAEGSPDAKIPNEQFSTAYSGKVRTDAAGTYWFLGFSDDDHYLYVNGKLVSVDTGAHGPRDPREGSNRDKIASVELAANTEYDLLYLQNENIGGASAIVRWVPPGGGEPAEIPPENLSTVTGPPAAPSGLAADGSAGNATRLTFKDVATNEIRYVLERAGDASFSSKKVVNFLPINSTAYTDATVTQGEAYFYRLVAVNYEGQSDPAVTQVTAGEKAGAPVAATVAAAQVPAGAPKDMPADTKAAAADVKPDAEGFVSLFNGKDLTGWRGRKDQWKVEDGAITGTTPEGQAREGSEYLIWDGGPVGDFELRLRFKPVGVNSGVQFRSTVINEGSFQVAGYQADIEDNRPITGTVWDQAGNRGTVGPLGQKASHKEDSIETEPLKTTAEEVLESVKSGDWNEMTITAVGNTTTVKVNGLESTVMVDDHAAASKSGAVALQLDHYMAGTIQFKDIKLKVLDAKPPAAAVAAAPKPATAPAPAAASGAPAAPKAETGFVSIFNGKDLTGWAGDSEQWKVQDGTITASVAAGETRRSSTYLVWEGGELTDFEVRLRFKGQSINSGVQVRSQVIDPAKFQVAGPQIDIGDSGPITGSVWDQGGNRGTLGALGFRTTYTAEGTKSAERFDPSTPRAADALKAGEWNEMSITAVENKTTVTINGMTTAEIIDDDPRAPRAGALALQLQFDPEKAGTIQFKDIRVKVLNGPPVQGIAALAGAAAAAAATAPAPAGPAPAWSFILAGGDRLTGSVSRWTAKDVVIRGVAGEVTVPVRRLREAWRGGADAAAQAKAQAASQGAVPEDTAFVRAENNELRTVRGVALGVEGDSLTFRFNDRDRKIALDRLAGVVFGETDDAKSDPFARSFHQSVLLASGDSLSGVWTGLAAGALELRTPWDAKLRIPADKVTAVKFRNGRLVYLSDLAPTRVEQVPYFDRMLTYQADRSLTGGRLKLSDGEYDRGIATHSRCVLQYDLAGAYARLKGKVGFQDPEGKLGNAAVRITGDGKPLFDRPEARGDKPPEEFDVDVGGVKVLSLEVDFGGDQDVGDRVVWANPRLLRADAKK